MKRVYLGNKELTTIATVTNGGGGGGDYTQKWVDYFNGTLTEFTIPEGVTKIKESAFYGCSNLTDITIPNSVTKIGEYAFFNCLNLTGITIPDKVTFIDYGAFGDCAKLKTITVEATTPPTLGDDAIPSNVTTIYVPASSVNTYKSSSGWKNYADKIQAIPTPAMKVTYVDNTEKTFYNLTSIGKYTDSNKANAKNVVIYDSVTSIGYNAFNGCEKLTGVTIPNTVTNIDGEAFEACLSLTDITIPNSVTSIGEYSFSECTGLNNVTIGNGVTNIGEGAFASCSSLISVIVKATVPPKVGWNPIQNNTNLTIHVPADSVDAYKSASGWNKFASKIQAIPS